MARGLHLETTIEKNSGSVLTAKGLKFITDSMYVGFSDARSPFQRATLKK